MQNEKPYGGANPEPATKEFDFQFEIAKAELGDADQFIIRGIASSPSVDRDDEQMSANAVKHMLEQIQSRKIPLMNEHGRNWNDRIGEVIDGKLTSDGKLEIEAQLNKKHPIAQYLYEKIKQGEQFGLSVAGKVKGFTQQMRTDLGKFVRVFDDIILNEISVTARPANWDAMGLVAKNWLEEIAKSVPAEEWIEAEKGTTMTDEETTTTTAAEAAEEEAAAAEATEGTDEETEAVEKSGHKQEAKPKRMSRAKGLKALKAFDDNHALLRAQLVESLGLEGVEKSDEDDTAPATEAVADEQEPAADETESIAKAVQAGMQAFAKSMETSTNEKLEMLHEELQKTRKTVDHLMSLPLRRKGIAAVAGTEETVIIKAKSDGDVTKSENDEPKTFAEAYKAKYGQQ